MYRQVIKIKTEYYDGDTYTDHGDRPQHEPVVLSQSMFPGKLKIDLNFILYHSVFPPDRAIVGIPSCIQRRPPEKQRKGQFSSLLLQGCMQA